MRIIEDGTKREMECFNCDLIFEYNIDDVRIGNCKHKEDIGTCEKCVEQYFREKVKDELPF